MGVATTLPEFSERTLPYPWKRDHKSLPDNKVQAVKRSEATEQSGEGIPAANRRNEQTKICAQTVRCRSKGL